MVAFTKIKPRNLDITGDFTVNALVATGNISASNIKSDHLLYANGSPYVFTTTAAGTNTQIQFNDGDSFAGSANLTFNKTTGTLTVAYLSGNGSSITNVNAATLNGQSATYYASTTYVDIAISNLVASAPAALDTLNELANALGNDANFSASITNSLANKLNTNAFNSTANAWIATQSTSNLSEGTNLYYTDTRANTAIDSRVTKSFVDSLSVVSNIANVAYSVAAANVSGTVANATYAVTTGTVVANSQPNITSVGALTSLSVAGTVSIPNIASLYVPGGTANYVLKTDGAGSLSWTAQSLGGNAIVGGNDTQVFFNDSNSNTLGTSANLTFNKTTSILTTKNIVVSGTTNLGNVSNLTVSGGNSNSYLKTDGAGTLTWETLPTTSIALDSYTGNGTRTAFDLSSTPTNANYTLVAVAGVLQPKSTYSVTGNVLTFSEAPPNSSPVEVTTINSGVSVPAGGGSGSGFTYQGISANATLVASTKYIVNTSSAAITLTLPASSVFGDEIGIIDGTGNAAINNITVYANGGNIMGSTGNLVVSSGRAAFTIVYYNATQGWLLTQI